MRLVPGSRLGPYEVVAPLGDGGMGEVYLAHDGRLDREVAVKVLSQTLAADPEARRHFLREARAAAALSHPNACAVFDVGTEGEFDFLVMERLEGRTLAGRLTEGPLAVHEALEIARQIAAGLAAAHRVGIVHCDVKPGNVVLTPSGPKVVDFGLARVRSRPSEIDATATLQTSTGGTPSYMSPEQAEGKAVDARADVFGFGVVLYEMLAGRRPFTGESPAAVAAAVLKDDPRPLRLMRPDVPAAVERIVLRCLEKDPRGRYASAEEVESDLGAAIMGMASSRLARRGPLLTMAAVAVVTLAALAGWLAWRDSRERWARQVALPEAHRLVDSGMTHAALRLILRAAAAAPGDAEIEQIRRTLSRIATIRTDPPGATVFVNDYSGGKDGWEPIGVTPLNEVIVPSRSIRLRLVLDGYETVDVGTLGGAAVNITLDRQGHSDGMVHVTAGSIEPEGLPAVDLEAFRIDKTEVTNRRFKMFVDAGGYKNRDYWKEPFVRDSQTVAWDEAMKGFRDATGRPGPATWQFGAFPDGHGDDPVGGLSWYEASAFAVFAGRSLPTVYHWRYAAGDWIFDDLLRLSNFDSKGPVPVASRRGLGPFGTYDMAGNVKEWCSNEAGGGRRYILGGGWDEPRYMFADLDAQSPWERKPDYGARCAQYAGPLPASQTSEVMESVRDYGHETPAGETTFTTFRRFFSFDRVPLDARLEGVDDAHPHWRRETVSFAAAYGGERVTGRLYLPKNADPPFETVVYFPGANALTDRSSQNEVGNFLTEFVVRSGRALFLPIYKGTFERRYEVTGPSAWRDMLIFWVKDLARSLDYVQSRHDLDASRIAYYGVSLGANRGPLFTALETRFRASVLLGGGFPASSVEPEIDPINYAPRVQVPTLMLNGRNDFGCKPESCSEPMFRFLGTPAADKKLILYDAGHIPTDMQPVIRDILEWLDRYLGPVPVR